MIGRFAQRRKGRIGIASRHLGIRSPQLSTMIKAAHGHRTYAIVTSLQSRMIETIKQTPCHGSFVFSGGRPFGLAIHHKFCTQTKAQANAPSRRDDSEPSRIRIAGRGIMERDQALMQETITYADSLKATKGKHGFLTEKNNLLLTPELGFCGKIYIAPKHSALAKASTIVKTNTDQAHFVFFVDGSLITKTGPESGAVVASCGAAVVYKPLEPKQPWVERYFAPSKCEASSDRIEVIAILDGLKIAAIETDAFRRCDPGDSDDAPAELKAILFSDCTSALQQLLRLQSRTVANSPILDDPIFREVMAVSQYLQRKGVKLELRWVPGHSLIPGNTLANGAAQYAARHPDISAILEERLRVKVEAIPRTAESRDS